MDELQDQRDRLGEKRYKFFLFMKIQERNHDYTTKQIVDLKKCTVLSSFSDDEEYGWRFDARCAETRTVNQSKQFVLHVWTSY